SLNLIDVNAPEVSYDGKKIVFAGLPDGNYKSVPHYNPGAWRIYMINVDGTGLKQITFSDRDDLDLSQFNSVNGFKKYDDTDPVWLPDGRIAFSSTRWPSLSQYNDERTTNIYSMDEDGSNMKRITSERNGADRPLVDPLTGQIVYSRWWRNFRNAANDMSTVKDPIGDGYIQHLGLVAESRSGEYGDAPDAHLGRNSWMLAAINPDGTGLVQFAGVSGIGSSAFSNQAYGGSFAEDGSLFTAFYPMHHISEAAGFGGIRHYPRGPEGYTPIIGVADEGSELVRDNPPSHRVFKGAYAADPEVLPDGRLLISWAPDTRQDYGLYTVNPDGSDLTLVYDNPNTSELRGRVVMPRPIPPIIPDKITNVASLLPPTANGPYDIDGTFTFDALNVFFNAPVDVDIVNALPIGSAGTIRFFIDHQRTSYGFPERLDWPILLDEIAINPDGSVSTEAPANVPLFEQIRTSQPDYSVPLTGSTFPAGENGAAHVAGHNFGRPGDDARCVGCHAGHTMIPVPVTDE
ncbi:MAG: PD40 domain-containing protein, partial [Anaerolineae bacterium]|nr:PD40 domain-containing protein [Anaerolineae bacterium]